MLYRLWLLLILACSVNVFASDFGTSGLIDVPTSRMMKDGELKLNINTQKIANILNFTYQATPWLETTFRYTIFNPDNPIRNSARIDGLNDRSYGIKANLVNESKFFPSVSVGIKDLLGTGAWSSEYVVASKAFNDLDVTLGAGWGRLSERGQFHNPFAKTFIEEDHIGGEKGGKIRSNSFFRSEDIGLFGGLSYYIPQKNIKIIAEYNSDAYEREISYNTIKSASPYSYGIEWHGMKNMIFGLSYQQGNQIGISFSSKIDTKTLLPDKKDSFFYSSDDSRLLSKMPESLDKNSWYHRLLFDFERSGLILRKARLSEGQDYAIVEISNLGYNLTVDAIRRALTLSEIHIPRSVKNLDLILNEEGIRVHTISYRRIDGKFNEKLRLNNTNITIMRSREIENPSIWTNFRVPSLTLSPGLSARTQLFDPEQPIKSQLYLKILSHLALPEEWVLRGESSINIKNNFDMNRTSSSRLPKVRTEIDKYLYQGSTGIDALYLEKKGNISDQTYYRFYAGLLEFMYGGIGVELLHQPFRSRFAFGATINKVRKRDYDRGFDMLGYKTETAFLSLYYASPFYNYDLSVHAGKYLAGDKGMTVEIARTFDNGFSIGAYATFTNVSAEEYGEGSFDKGITIRVPFDAFTKSNTKQAFRTSIKSIQRDGGQKLDDFTGNLWINNRGIRYDSINNNKSRMAPLW
tara:strand:- start:10281 stop:12356 length:2076 start_codon:yes stop_codon:yes gene_type:complete